MKATDSQPKTPSLQPSVEEPTRPDGVTNHDDVLLELQEKTAIIAAAERLTKLRWWFYDLASHCLKWSSKANSIFNFPPEERQDLSFSLFFKRIHPRDRPAVARLVREVLEGKRRTFTFKCRFLAASGEHKDIVVEGEALLGLDGNVERVVGGLMEVNDYERTRERQASDYRIRAVEESSVDWLWEQNQEFRFTSLTRIQDEALNETHSSTLGKRLWETPSALPCNGTWEDHKKVLEQRLPFHDFEFRVPLVAGGERIFSTTGEPAYTRDGRFIGYRGTGSDITCLKAAQETASRSQALLQLVSRVGRVGAWELDLQTMECSWSSELLNLYELESHQRVTPELLVSLVAADYRDAIGAAMQACHRQGTPVDFEFPSVTAKGTHVWLRLIAEAVRERSGRIVRVQGAVQDITDRRRSSERLLALNHQLTTTFESITDGFVTIDREWRFTYVNGEAERRSGLSRADLLGKSLPDLFPAFVDSDFRREFERALREGTAGTAEAFSTAFRRWLNVRVFPSEQGLALYIRDVTDSKQAQQELVLSEERYRLLFETSADGIVKVGLDGMIRRVNRAACEMFGRTEAQMMTLLAKQLVSPADRRVMVLDRQQRGTSRGEMTMLRADGSTFEAEVNASTFRNAEGNSFFNVVIRDATERIKLRQKLMALNEEMAHNVRQRTRELESANSELRNFARSLAHDLRQPIAAAKFLGFAVEMSLAKDDVENARKYSGQVSETAQWLGNYVDALLSLTRISQAVLAVEDVDLSALASGLLDELQYEHPGRHALVEVEQGLHARGDRTLLRVLLQNLLSNAWKFTSRKEVARVSFKAITSCDGEVVYSVEDDGAGFDASLAERIFETFQRFHKESEFPGTGIGLANAHKIVLKHGGRIWAESEPDQGAKFFFTLARQEEQPATAAG